MPPPGPPAPGPPTDPTAAVRALQQRLADLSFLPAEAVDGKAGEQTRFAVIAFQKWQGLGRDGVAGPATQAALATAHAADAANVAAPEAASRCCSTASSRSTSRTAPSSARSRLVGSEGIRDAGRPLQRLPQGSELLVVPYKVWLPWASYFVGGVAFHESPDVPAEPPRTAVSGCRVRREVGLRPRPERHAGHRARELSMRAAATTALLALALALPVAAAAPPPTQNPDELVVGVSMPVTGLQVGAVRGRTVVLAKGLEIDLARALAKRLGVPRVRFVNEPFFSTLVSGRPADWDLALAAITITPERARRRRLLHALSHRRPGRADAPGLHSRPDLDRGTPRPSALQRAGDDGRPCDGGADEADAEVAAGAPNPSQLTYDLYNDRCDAIVFDRPSLGAAGGGTGAVRAVRGADRDP